MKIGFSLKLAAVASVAALALSGCGAANSSNSDDNPYHLITPGTILASTSGDQPPFSVSDQSGNSSGFVVDITNEVAERLDLKVTYKMATTSAGIQGLTSGQYDLVANGLGITDERKKSIDFAKGLYWSDTAVLTKDASTGTSFKDFAGKKVGVLTGSVQADYLAKKIPTAVATDFDSQNAAVSSLNSGTIDAVMLGGPDAEQYLKKFPDLKIAASEPVDHATTVAVQKGNSALADAFDKEVQAMVDDGTYMKIYNKYFTEKPQPQLVEIWPGIKQ